MIKNYISTNISYLVRRLNIGQDEFGQTFEVGKGLISNYINGRALPKIETIQRICLHFEITIDDFINKDLSAPKVWAMKQGQLLYADEPVSEYPETISPRYVAKLEKTIEEKDQALKDKEKIIVMLEEKLQTDEKSKTA